MKSVVEASTGAINRGWAVSFLLAIATLCVIWQMVPQAKQLVVGKDGRWSTSKFQAIAWTFVILFALFSLFWAYAMVQFGNLVGWGMLEHLNGALGESFTNFFAKKFDSTYLVLLGLPLGTAVASKAITTTKISNGTEVKPPKPEGPVTTGGETGAIQELVGNDEGETELTDFQYLLFNLLAIAYFLVAFMSHPSLGLPSMPDTLIGLTGVAAATYIGKKGLYKEPPVLLGVIPPSAKPGETITVYGQHLMTHVSAGRTTKEKEQGAGAGASADDGFGAMVVIGGHAAKVEAGSTPSTVTAKVPEMVAGASQLNVVRPPGATSESLPFTVEPKAAS